MSGDFQGLGQWLGSSGLGGAILHRGFKGSQGAERLMWGGLLIVQQLQCVYLCVYIFSRIHTLDSSIANVRRPILGQTQGI